MEIHTLLDPQYLPIRGLGLPTQDLPLPLLSLQARLNWPDSGNPFEQAHTQLRDCKADNPVKTRESWILQAMSHQSTQSHCL